MSDGAYVCINCGAALAFAAAPGGELPATAACSFCGVINDRAQMDLIRDRADARRNELAKSGRQRFVYATMLVLFNLVVDVAYAWVDPRIELS